VSATKAAPGCLGFGHTRYRLASAGGDDRWSVTTPLSENSASPLYLLSVRAAQAVSSNAATGSRRGEDAAKRGLFTSISGWFPDRTRTSPSLGRVSRKSWSLHVSYTAVRCGGDPLEPSRPSARSHEQGAVLRTMESTFASRTRFVNV